MFVEGISGSDGSGTGDDLERFLRAEEEYHRPLFERLPFVLENYLVNYMFQNLFPYGREGGTNLISRSIFDEYIRMATRFAWINGLLVGVAGYCKEAFAGEHVVQTIQSVVRTVEHYPDVLKSIDVSIRSRELDSLQGMAVLLRS
ncbi:hypothetical protein [Granulicella sp. dw_53]|uniref:hypothetical protein n=1 Tax=Granulicella sp. dw_53 TaxID=2719792 RepID=UPI001BD1D855|nr:hypothetical protein [Granulicella sp. dw_53]